uniref:Uncharacterized protein n=1 Tax=Arundo donax TaxID=35708 RepID=A0A0A8YUL3_ARUDO
MKSSDDLKWLSINDKAATMQLGVLFFT